MPPTATLHADIREAARRAADRLARQAAETAAERAALAAGPQWRGLARPDQLPPKGDWRTWYIRGGRDSGKTWTGAHALAEIIEGNPAGDYAVLAPTYGAARDVCIEGRKSGLLQALGGYPGPKVRTWNRSIGELLLTNGSIVYVDGADDGALRIQGKRLRAAWCDEIGLWRRWQLAWDESLRYAITEAPARIVATGTPKVSMAARALVKRLLEDETVPCTRLLTVDNRAHIDPQAFAAMMSNAGTRMGRQELEGELLEDIDGALWRSDWIDHDRPLPDSSLIRRIVVALDPSDGRDDGDEQGIAVVALDRTGHFYVLHSDGLRVTPRESLLHAARLYREHSAAALVIEKNHGQGYLLDLARMVIADVPVSPVSATLHKRTRAEPIATLYEQRRVTHVGDFPLLEEQMVSFTGRPGERSPDRLDALVWAMTDLLRSSGARPVIVEAPRGSTAADDPVGPLDFDVDAMSF